jgi:hypothetical protein
MREAEPAKPTEPAQPGIIVLSAPTCEVLAQALLQQPIGQALLSVVRGEHGVAPEVEMVLMLQGWLAPREKVPPAPVVG